jgi:hypothetical protein
MMKAKLLLVLLVSGLYVHAAAAQQNPVKNSEVLLLEKVVVKGVIQGPDLWKVTHGDHVMWILGTINPLPKKMQWDSYHVADVISHSDVLLLPPTVKADLGFFKTLMLARAAIGIKKNPNKKQLKDILPPDLYRRWLILKQKYLGNSRRIEKNRPFIAIHELFNKALNKSGLDENSKISKKVQKLAKKHRLTINQPTWEVTLNEPKAALKNLKNTDIDDLACFEEKLQRLEVDLDAMKARATAWAYGDMVTLRSLPIPKDNETCGSALLNSEFAEQIGLLDVRARLRGLWLEAAINSLENYPTTFAVLPIFNLMGENSFLDDLSAMGYFIKAPEN